MTSTSVCKRVRTQLGAFVDGELSGPDRSALSRHLEDCAKCVEEEQALRDLGHMLRGGARALPRVDLTGLSGGLISRIRAEQAQSWRALFARAVEDWHWALVGGGSLAAGAVSILFVSALLWFGPSPSRADSLEALLNNLGAPAGTLLIYTTPNGRDSMLMRFDNGPMDGTEGLVAVPVSFSSPGGQTEEDLTSALSDAMVGSNGRVSELRGMSRPARQHTEALLDEIQRLRYPPPAGWSSAPVGVLRLGLVTSTIVTGKAL
jgi:hypothetical protein